MNTSLYTTASNETAGITVPPFIQDQLAKQSLTAAQEGIRPSDPLPKATKSIREERVPLDELIQDPKRIQQLGLTDQEILDLIGDGKDSVIRTIEVPHRQKFETADQAINHYKLWLANENKTLENPKASRNFTGRVRNNALRRAAGTELYLNWIKQNNPEMFDEVSFRVLMYDAILWTLDTNVQNQGVVVKNADCYKGHAAVNHFLASVLTIREEHGKYLYTDVNAFFSEIEPIVPNHHSYAEYFGYIKAGVTAEAIAFRAFSALQEAYPNVRFEPTDPTLDAVNKVDGRLFIGGKAFDIDVKSVKGNDSVIILWPDGRIVRNGAPTPLIDSEAYAISPKLMERIKYNGRGNRVLGSNGIIAIRINTRNVLTKGESSIEIENEIIAQIHILLEQESENGS